MNKGKIMSASGSNIDSPSKDSLSSGHSNNNTGVSIDVPSREMSQLSLFSSGGSSTTQDEFFKCEGHAEQSLQSMRTYLQAGQLCDVVLIAGADGRRVSSHR